MGPPCSLVLRALPSLYSALIEVLLQTHPVLKPRTFTLHVNHSEFHFYFLIMLYLTATPLQHTFPPFHSSYKPHIKCLFIQETFLSPSNPRIRFSFYDLIELYSSSHILGKIVLIYILVRVSN